VATSAAASSAANVSNSNSKEIANKTSTPASAPPVQRPPPLKTASVGAPHHRSIGAGLDDRTSVPAKAKAVPTPKLPPQALSSETPEERLDNLIKSFTKEDASSSSIHHLHGLNESTSEVASISVGPSIIIPNNQVQQVSQPKPKSIPDMKCNILKAKEQNLIQQQQVASAEVIVPIIECNTCNGRSHDESAHDMESDNCKAKSTVVISAAKSAAVPDVVTLSNSGLKNGPPPPVPPRNSPAPTTLVQHSVKPRELAASNHSLDVDFADDDDTPLLGANDTNNVTVIKVENALSPAAVDCDTIAATVVSDNNRNIRELTPSPNSTDMSVHVAPCFPSVIVKPFVIGNPESENEDFDESSGSADDDLEPMPLPNKVIICDQIAIPSPSVMTTDL